MQERADRYAGLQRYHTPTVDDPFVLVVVDEVAFLTAYQSDKGLKLRISAALATLTTQGRAVGFGVMAALQDPRKEVMNIRNLFPDKIALRLDESEQVDMVLGDGARDRGALADHISPIPAQGAGVALCAAGDLTRPDPGARRLRLRRRHPRDGAGTAGGIPAITEMRVARRIDRPRPATETAASTPAPAEQVPATWQRRGCPD